MDESQPIPLSVEQCKDLLKMIGQALCVKAELISTRLLSKDDKQDMLNGLISVESLMTAVQIWIKHGMPNYAQGNSERLEKSFEYPLHRYQKEVERPVKRKFRPFKEYNKYK